MENDKLTHISFIKQGKASYVLPNYLNREFVHVSEGEHLGLTDIAFKILDEQAKMQEKQEKREKRRLARDDGE